MIFDRCRGALPRERVIDSARRPEIEPPSDRRRCLAAPMSAISAFPGVIEANVSMRGGSSVLGKFFACQQSPHDNPTATQRDPANTVAAPPMPRSRWCMNRVHRPPWLVPMRFPRCVSVRIGATSLHRRSRKKPGIRISRSEEHTSELQSRQYLVCRLLLEKKKY